MDFQKLYQEMGTGMDTSKFNSRNEMNDYISYSQARKRGATHEQAMAEIDADNAAYGKQAETIQQTTAREDYAAMTEAEQMQADLRWVQIGCALNLDKMARLENAGLWKF